MTRGVLLLIASVVMAFTMAAVGEDSFPGLVAATISTGCFIWGLAQILGRKETN